MINNKIKQQEEDFEDLKVFSSKPEVTMKSVGEPVYIYDFPINGKIEEVEKYQNLFDVFRVATEGDAVILTINTCGGLLHTAQQICAEIESSAATVIGCVVGDCSSAGTIIAMSCDSLYIAPDSSWLFHTGSYGTSGMAPHVEARVEHYKALMKRVAEKYYKDVLTEEEIARLIRGDQLYFFGDEISKRLAEKAEEEQEDEDGEAITHEEMKDRWEAKKEELRDKIISANVCVEFSNNIEDLSTEQLEDVLRGIEAELYLRSH